MRTYSANIYLFQVNYKNIRKKYKICSKFTIKTPERRHWRCSGVFIVYFEHILHLSLVFLLLTLNTQMLVGSWPWPRFMTSTYRDVSRTFAKIWAGTLCNNNYEPLTVVTKISILDTFGSPGYASDLRNMECIIKG